jgi:hypothetical protein
MSRFALQWLLPGQPEAFTHVMLLDTERPAPYVMAAGHGADRLQAFRNLCSTLIELGEVSEAIDFVVTEFTRRAGKSSD